jgi:hypothetical protein
MSELYQFVWWGWCDMDFGFFRHTSSIGLVYDWSLHVGPLEIRRWRRNR